MRTRWVVAVAVAVVLVAVGVGAVVRHERSDGPFRLAKPQPTTIRALGLVPPPPTHACANGVWGRCVDYVDGWCQAPCATYRVQGTVVSVRRATWRPYYGYVMVLREGDTTIAARSQRRPAVRPGDLVRVSGVLFFPTPRGRDGGNTPNGAELSPLLDAANLTMARLGY